jgi:outer membrane lipopolysaccharide assembly protein LptE/RlpB
MNVRWTKLTIRSLLILFLLLLGGCGYQMSGKETHVPPGVNSIAIPTFGNKTLEPGLETQFTQAFLREFIFDKRVKVVARGEADSILQGVVKSFVITSQAYDASGLVLEYITMVVIDLTLIKPTGEVLWRVSNLSEAEWYRVTSSGLTNETSKSLAVQQIARTVAQRARNLFFYNF